MVSILFYNIYSFYPLYKLYNLYLFYPFCVVPRPHRGLKCPAVHDYKSQR